MRKIIIILLPVLILISSMADGGNEPKRYRIGFLYGLGNLKAGEVPNYTFNHAWGFGAGINGRRTTLSFSLLSQKNYSDSSASGHFGFFSGKDDAERVFKSLRAGFDFDYRLREKSTYCPTVGLGLGYLIWKYTDPEGDTVVQAVGERDNTVDFSAAEMYISGALGLEIAASQRVTINFKTSIDYLTGVGASFNDSIDNIRGRMMMRVGIGLSYHFGLGGDFRPSSESWPSSSTWSQQQEKVRSAPGKGDTDGDGIEDRRDKCPGTLPGVVVDKAGCALDSDGDGVADGRDDCPRTPRSAIGFVDIFGCPVDSDFDGVPDFRDTCLASPAGAAVDEYGCPIDGDSDGVYDGRDDCPNTALGIEVDTRGCIDIAFLRDTMRINIDYQSGSFEVDLRTRERLQPLIRKLLILDEVNVAIQGFTDNIGSAEANQSLSQKRANRMRDWLVTEGIAIERLTAVGKGETNFIASNQTADGRALNRRIELIFSR